MKDSPPRRPDPDALLAHVTAREADERRGRLRIYFGASAGVGKTFAMLLEAQRLAQEGKDVVLGLVETHGRAKTTALLESEPLPVIAPNMLDVQGTPMAEFNIDAALLRHPDILIVDELAHTNLPGSRHPKRWQDIDELLASGIDVMTTLNVQHLESLRDVVFGITGVRVAETLPDTFFNSANEVILVDLPTEDLLKRLSTGQVYRPEQAERASKSFFRPGNLYALRELALRRTAERVETDVQGYRIERAILPVWKTRASILCCIGPSPHDDMVVRGAARLATELDVPWHAVYVETPRLSRLPSEQRARIISVVQLAASLGAKTAILSGSKVADVLIDYAREQNHARVVVGRSSARRLPFRDNLAISLGRLAPDLDLIELSAHSSGPATSANAIESAPLPIEKIRSRRRGYAAAIGACIFTSLVTTPLLPFLSLTNIAMLFLLTVALVAVRFGRNAAVLAAFLNVAAYDFFFVPPRFSFAVADIEYVVTFVVMLVVGLIIGELTSRLRYQARVASHREQRSRSLYEFARDLASALRAEDVERIGTETLAKSFRCEAIMLQSADDGRLEIPDVLSQRQDFEPAIAVWSFEHRSSAGLGTDTLPRSDFRYLPLVAPMRVRGVLAVKPANRRQLLIPEQTQHLNTFVALIAIALERVHYVDVAQDALVSIESEKLRNSLLAAVSHDLRSPLAAVVGLAEALENSKQLPPELQSLTASIVEQAQRMRALVTNLLEMARIEAGQVQVNAQWHPVSELIGTTLSAWRLQLGNRAVQSVFDDADMPVFADAVMVDRMLSNLLENALRYTPPDSPIRIYSHSSPNSIQLIVEDQGPGLPAAEAEHVFAKFVRGRAESNLGGIGLGLTIARALARAQGGDLRLDASYVGGARFIIELPQPPMPQNIRDAMAIDAHE
jgi:two-component system sensor histidine kinase KdpD